MIAAPKTRSKYSCAQLEFQATALTMEQKLSSVRTLSAAMWPGRNQKAHCGLQRDNKHVLRKQMWRASVIQTPTLEVQAGVSHLSAVKWLHKIMRYSIRYSISEGLCIYDYLCSQWLCHAMPFQSFCRIMSCFSGLRFLCLSRPEGLPPVNFSSFSLCDAVDVWWQVMTLSYTLSWHH